MDDNNHWCSRILHAVHPRTSEHVPTSVKTVSLLARVFYLTLFRLFLHLGDRLTPR